MENQENNNLSELEQLKAQYETLKEQFDQQEILNDRLMKSAIQTNVDFFTRNRKTAMILYPIMAVLLYIYFDSIGFRAFGLIMALLLAVCTFVELWLTRNTRQQVVENSDLLTLSKNMQQLKTGYAIYLVIWLLVCFVFGAVFAFKVVDTQGLSGARFMNVIWLMGFIAVLIVVFGIIAYRTFVGHCNNIIRQIDAVKGKPTTKKNLTFWYFMGGLVLLLAAGISITYYVMKPATYSRLDNDLTTEGKLEIRVLDADTLAQYPMINALTLEGKPMVQKVVCSKNRENEETPIIVYLTPEAARLWYQFTTEVTGHKAGLVMDDEVIQDWQVMCGIENGSFFIMKEWSSKDELKDFCNNLIKQ